MKLVNTRSRASRLQDKHWNFVWCQHVRRCSNNDKESMLKGNECQLEGTPQNPKLGELDYQIK